MSEWTSRNQPILSDKVQKKLKTLRVAFAGCGLGSCVAESFARLGLENFVLIDNDTIESHNLNRQSFEFSDIGSMKVNALKKRILAINPSANVDARPILVSKDNVAELMRDVDLIIDTVDFLDLRAIVALHDEALRTKKDVISLFTAGWGAVGMYIPAEQRQQSWARELFEISPTEYDDLSYKQSFIKFFSRVGPHLNPSVAQMMNHVFKQMMDNKPCPAPNVISGAQSAAIIAVKLLSDVLDGGRSVIRAPNLVYLDLEAAFREVAIS